MRWFFPIILGLGGFAILASLGVWQLQRHTWKQGVLAEITAKIAGEAQPMPRTPEEHFHKYDPVVVQGQFTGKDIAVLTSVEGPAYRLIAAFQTEDRLIMVDRGWVPSNQLTRTEAGEATVTGNLHWPDEQDSWTPPPDLENGIFYARDVGSMSEALNTDPILIVAREPAGTPPATPLPVGIEGIANNHWGYAIQWFGLALVWLGMTAFWLRRKIGRKV